MPETNIYISAKDNFSDAIKKMQQTVTPFRKDINELGKELDTLSRNKTDLKVEVNAAQVELRAAQKAFKELADEAEDSEKRISAASRLGEAQEALDKVTNSYRLVSKQLRQTEKDMTGLGGTLDKQSTRMQDSWLGGLFGSDVAGKLNQTGVLKMLGESLGTAAETFSMSYFGKPTATYVGGTLSGAASGAAMGSVAGLPGMAAGALIGGVSGAISAYTQVQSEKDDYFKNYVQEQFETVMAEETERLSSGSSIAGSREQTRMAFAQRFGSEEAADAYLERVKTMAMDTNYEYDEITGYSKSLLNSYDPDAVFGVLQRLSDATAGLNLSSSDVNMMIAGLSRMRTTNKATSEYLNYFSERGVDVYQALADSTGADKSRIADMVTGGDISGMDAAQAILDYINETYGGLSAKLAATYDAMVDNLGDYEAELEASMGEGYNETRKQGIQDQMDFLDGESGQKMQEAYYAIGSWRAELENQKEQYVRDAMTEMMQSEKYQQAELEGNSAEMGRLMAQAKVRGIGEYNASEGAQEALEYELALAGSIRDDAATNEAYWDAGYQKGNEFTKGMMASLAAGVPKAVENGAYTANQYAAEAQRTGSPQTAGVDYYGRITAADLNRHAFGLNRVPYDGYPAMLHENERVLTANQARQQDAGGTGNVTIAGGNYYIREEADIDRVAEALARKVLLAKATARP